MKHKREYRELRKETKTRISNALTGRKKSAAHRKKISESMIAYWSGVPNRIPTPPMNAE